MGESSLLLHHALRAYVLPKWRNHIIDNIQREDITKVEPASSEIQPIFAERVCDWCFAVRCWAEKNGYIKRPTGWLDGIEAHHVRRAAGRWCARSWSRRRFSPIVERPQDRTQRWCCSWSLGRRIKRLGE